MNTLQDDGQSMKEAFASAVKVALLVLVFGARKLNFGEKFFSQSTNSKSMYSPKICEDLIPRIYRAAKAAKLPMTAWVNQAVERALPETATSQQNPQPSGEREGANDER